ncbi:hypothetical protein [Streptomyces griseorubiginosus]|uniref:hypothetical protein n=1 Tax=Streptomyces griseorubiginosus TaxID=67304 RepID=UPI000B13E578|nr:hypothetical protein [Streptomyces griseorubiginosus]
MALACASGQLSVPLHCAYFFLAGPPGVELLQGCILLVDEMDERVWGFAKGSK